MATTAQPPEAEGPVAEGYRDRRYASSLSEFGVPRALARSGGWILERPIPGTDARDAMGTYPLFACHDWSALKADLDGASDELVSLTVVTDPFGAYDVRLLEGTFRDLVRPFKLHYLVGLDETAPSVNSSKNRLAAKKATRAMRALEIEVVADAPSRLDTWTDLHAHLVARYQVTGIRAFSRASFERLLGLPDVTLILAWHHGVAVAAHLYVQQDDVVHYHLGAAAALGYTLEAAYALHGFAIEHFASRGRWLDLGGTAGLSDRSDGLSRYKSHWATETRWAYLCGRVLDGVRYREIAVATGRVASDYFPAYRAGELG